MKLPTNDNYTNQEFYQKMYEDSDITREDLIILTCAIFIASIGLNMNSQATIIGAMLISPLMSPILAIGTAIAIYDQQLLQRAAKTLLIEVGLSILVASCYFYFSPISHASQEIINRTSPTIWDVLIAFFGGAAGIIGARKKSVNNIVPGVAIATALMPPICTVGYAIASKNLAYMTGAAYLFIINAFCIILTTIAGVKSLRMPTKQRVNAQPRLAKSKRILYIVLTILIIIPSLVSANSLVHQSILEANVKNFANEELAHTTIIKQSIDEEKQTLRFTIAGNDFTDQKIQDLQNDLVHYGLKGYQLKITQIAELSQLSGKQFEDYINSIIEANQSNQLANKNTDNDDSTENAIVLSEKIQQLSPDTIQQVTVATGYQKDQWLELVIIQPKKTLSADEKKQLSKKIMKRYPEIDQVFFTDLNQKQQLN
ncbi:TIGR00341 family protein [Enterococcus columbae]|uniref:TIGR00341 family protein n=1 Tax=Enterococcus columbae DSM 7374 = ATCC 51263 TaxID=1121865 RepID=S1MVB8_9ENTE|nr:TIGR00341 family protein [Enterococcus columbae]EOT41845.1 TIGR00341 family protein [Enterococcus columbae DSM 7374 = ATCC 51263]EOW80640.1 TIGR00341 family protein [Enterococcus columbae DSM 7374 = ATCC 51263]OJG26277.1 TIGR00341 family protein [Enterococcus columbae DSM 7374 = ATCC 51263]